MSARNDRTEATFSRGRRALISALVALTLSLAVAPTASASSIEDMDAVGHVNPVLDVLLLRPLGIVATALGVGLFAVGLPILAITRPTDLGPPAEVLIMKPIQYTWIDPIGDHSGPRD